MSDQQGELRLAVLGVGMMGAFHADRLSRVVRGARVSVINDARADQAALIAGQIPGARVEPDPRAAIEADDVDAVVIASPGRFHAEQVAACLDRGIPVLAEKPLTTDAESAYRIVQREAALPNPLIQVGFMRRFDTEYAQLRTMIESGRVGVPLLLHCVHRNPAARPEFDSSMMITDSVVHEVDVVRFLFGEEIATVQVIKPTPTPGTPDGQSDPMLVLLTTEGGKVATVEIFARSGAGYQVRTELVGSAGSALVGLDRGLIATERSAAGVARSEAIAPTFIERFATAYTTELQRFVDAARTGGIDGPGAWDGYAAAAVCEAGVAAVRTSEPVPVSLQPRP
ncbi:Gfo/Idh/MocA family protein [Microlunatus sp. GCM10028923]|uniref:Gfo/Idh/MocA family protein n=1 Tax=Microlunatus sp. GCM10028923 TaxID=3273400 RepID=UPI00360AA339